MDARRGYRLLLVALGALLAVLWYVNLCWNAFIHPLLRR